MRWTGLAVRAAAGVLAAAVAHAAAAVGETGAQAPAGVVETLTVVSPSPPLPPGREATVILRATFTAQGVYADPRVVTVEVHAGVLEPRERQRLEREALRAFNAVRKWRLRAPPGAALPENGSPVDVRVRFVTVSETPRRD